MKEFNGLLRSEHKKVRAYAKKNFGVECSITGICYKSIPDELGFVEVSCEICDWGMDSRVGTVVMQVFMEDRRMSFCSSAIDLR